MVGTSTQEPAGIPAWVEPMLAKPHNDRLPTGSQWTYEDKVDFCVRFGLLA
jgi:bifunctional non-homologous end joining protein LigD